MQKVINALAIVSFLGTETLIGGGAYVYFQREAIKARVMGQVAEAATEAIAGALPSLMDSATPKLPEATGGAIIPAMP